jgi:hypothetical protein
MAERISRTSIDKDDNDARAALHQREDITGDGVFRPVAHRNSRGSRAVMTQSKGANSSGLQVQSVVARVNFPHEGTRGLISNSRGIVEKAIIVLLQATCKTTSLSCVPNSTEWLSSTRCKYK